MQTNDEEDCVRGREKIVAREVSKKKKTRWLWTGKLSNGQVGIRRRQR